MSTCWRVAACWLLLAAPCLGDVRLPRVLSSGMVLQREASVQLWGWADPGEVVRIRGDWLGDAEVATTADPQGRWVATIRTGPAGGPHALEIAAANRVKLDDILFGEVWLASGQSNMEMPLVRVSGAYTAVQEAEREVAEADHPQIRLFQVGNFSSREPLEDVETGITMYGVPVAKCQWQACTPETVATFASTAYFFARELHRELRVPIGIIDAAWGGTAAEAWTPAAGLERLGYTAELQQARTAPQQPDQKIPTRLYNGMIHPLRRLRMQGVIWYQGESNVGQADRYRQLFSTMISQWREAFEQPLPFYYVQIAPYQYRGHNAALLREAQLDVLSLPQTGMVVTLDIGNLTDIHPKNKQEVGRRLALWALAGSYGRQVVCSGPLLVEASFQDAQARLTFKHAEGGLRTRDGQPPSDFELAGEDGVFHPATATLVENQVILRAEQVAAPRAARYAFSSEAMPNLVNRAGLPASSFRTDR